MLTVVTGQVHPLCFVEVEDFRQQIASVWASSQTRRPATKRGKWYGGTGMRAEKVDITQTLTTSVQALVLQLDLVVSSP